ncbi:MAG: sugar-binding domain-containing protein [Prevotella sp.]
MNIGIVRKSFWLSLGMLFCVAISPSFAAPDMAGESKGSSVNSTVRTDLSTREINLAGTWMFATDPNDEGLKEGWVQRDFKETVTLPGSMMTNDKGNEVTAKTNWIMAHEHTDVYYKSDVYAPYRQPGNVKIPFILQPNKHYVGVAWYKRTVNISPAWKGKIIKLFLERCHWRSVVFVDGERVGDAYQLCAPQEFDLTEKLTPGRHELCIRVDNRITDINPGVDAHSISDETQGAWNGIAGKMTLKALPCIYIDRTDLFPSLNDKSLTVVTEVDNRSGKTQQADINIEGINFKQRLSKGLNQLTFKVPLPDNAEPWDEFHPNLYNVKINLRTKAGEETKTYTYGCRSLSTKDGYLRLNGKQIFLRGTLDCASYPLTGYPSFDKSYWIREFSVCRSFGLNHVRFHSWCPPEVAFEAADEMGIYLYVECSSWANHGIGDGAPVDKWVMDESEAIVRAYGNHPSFIMMSYGNEPGGKHSADYLRNFVNHWKAKDNRRIYCTAAGWPNIEESDYLSDPTPRIQRWGEGTNSIINAKSPSTTYDWSDYINKFKQPMISHEIGQWCVYPDFEEIRKYTGVYKARNFEIFRDFLQQNGLLHLADSFLLASGHLQTLCYKADIEAALRTKRFGGFQLLGLNDFSGQGTALVGAVNPFWETKRYTTPEEYSKFCGSLVPLARMEKLVYHNNETFKADVEIANFEEELNNPTIEWRLRDANGMVLKEGRLHTNVLPIGNCLNVGKVRFALNDIAKPSQLKFELTINGKTNDWNIWVYPDKQPVVDRQIIVTDTLDAQTLKRLQGGAKVLLSLGKGRVAPDMGGKVAVGFSSIFWNTWWTGGQAPQTLGILCDPRHPALADFPTQYYSDYQWFDMMSQADAIEYTKLSDKLSPVVRIIDDWFTARPLALLVEARVGKGSIIISGADLIHDLADRPAALQLRASLTNYMSGHSFAPKVKLGVADLQKLFR